MTVDESSSQDATLIDDDLVAALGFEPVDSSNGHDADAARGGTDVSVPDIEDDAGDGEVSDDAEIGSADDETAVDETAVDETAVIDSSGEDDAEAVIEDVAAADLSTDGATDDGSAGVSAGSGSFFDLDFDADAELDADADFDAEADPERDAAVDPADDGEVDASVVDVIDLDRLDAETVDEAEAPAVDDEDLEPFDLADSDSVFADVAVGDHTEHADHQPTESLLVAEAPSPDGTIVDDSTVDGDVAEVAAPATKRRAPSVKRRRRLRARKSRRVIRHIDPWSVLTFSVVFHMVVFASLLLSSVLVWNAAIASGMVENVESFIQELGDYETFEINADVMFRAAVVIAGMLTLASSVMVVLLTVVFNLISDLVGGIRVTVIEEETVRIPIDKKRSKAPVD